MQKEQKEQIRQSIKAEMAAKGLSQNGWADKKGISKSHMTNILKPENWHKVGTRTWNDLANKVAAVSIGSKLYPTSNMRIITAACKDAQANK